MRRAHSWLVILAGQIWLVEGGFWPADSLAIQLKRLLEHVFLARIAKIWFEEWDGEAVGEALSNR